MNWPEAGNDRMFYRCACYVKHRYFNNPGIANNYTVHGGIGIQSQNRLLFTIHHYHFTEFSVPV